jgi:hypothetical protein
MPVFSSHALAIFAALALGAAPPAGAAGQPDRQDLVPIAAKEKQRHVTRPQARQRKIACTRYGCFPVPPGCHPIIAFDPFGNPTGYDAIFCPNRR